MEAAWEAFAVFLTIGALGVLARVLLVAHGGSRDWRGDNVSSDRPTHARALERYLSEFELELKRRPGVVPEDALVDAFQMLQNELAAVEQEESEEELVARLTTAIGSPAKLADGYWARAGRVETGLGYAPGWRLFCRACRRSAPAARAGIIRIGAWSWGKRVLGFCKGCGNFRFLSCVKDLDRPTLTRELLADPSGALAARDRRRDSLTGRTA
jgi:hypothetical protein